MGKDLYNAANDPKLFYEYEGEHLEAPQKHITELVLKIEQLMK